MDKPQTNLDSQDLSQFKFQRSQIIILLILCYIIPNKRYIEMTLLPKIFTLLTSDIVKL
jgi:hypothetical protein